MTNFSILNSQDVLIDGALPEYEKGMEFFYLQLVQLNITLYIVEQIQKFPLELFVEPDKAIFFKMVIRNFFDAGLLVITRLATDQGDDLYTLRRFKNRLRELIKPELLAEFDKRLKQWHFDKNTKVMFNKAEQLRVERVAHVKQDVVLGISEGTHLNFLELKSLRDTLNSLLESLSFNEDHKMLPPAYDPYVQRPIGNNSTDIEELLDFVARNSAWIDLPERNAAKWNYWRAKLNEAQISQINFYRKKFGLPEA